MVQNTNGMHHLHLRKRINLKDETYPHPEPFKRFMDKAIYVVGLLGILMTIPQIIQIYVLKNASGVNALTWGTYVFTAICWTIYGSIHKDKAVIITNALWILINFLVLLGVIIYG